MKMKVAGRLGMKNMRAPSGEVGCEELERNTKKLFKLKCETVARRFINVLSNLFSNYF